MLYNVINNNDERSGAWCACAVSKWRELIGNCTDISCDQRFLNHLPEICGLYVPCISLTCQVTVTGLKSLHPLLCVRGINWALQTPSVFHSDISPGGRLQLNTHALYMCGFAWSDMLHGVHRTRWNGSSFMWHQPCQRCKHTTLVDIQRRAIRKSYSLMKIHTRVQWV